MTSDNKISTLINAITFNEEGLVPVIAQADKTGEILMMAWMNRDALAETLTTGRMCYWSRSRKALWRKGEESKQYQTLKELIVDCDGDTLLAKVEQTGVACHTGHRSCFYSLYKNGELVEIEKPVLSPEELYSKSEKR